MSLWQGRLAELALLLAELGLERQSCGLFQHPVGGWMGMPQVLEFFRVHVTHHDFQLARLRARMPAV